MQVSSVSQTQSRKNLFIKYANSFMNFKADENSEEPVSKPEKEPLKKVDKTMGIETLTIFPKLVVDGKTIITA